MCLIYYLISVIPVFAFYFKMRIIPAPLLEIIMSTLTLQDIQKMSELSKLELPAEKIPAITNSLENILTLVEKMNAIDTSQVEPLAHPFNATQPLRMDVVTEKNQRDLFQQNAPSVESGLYIVPKFVEAE